MFLATLRAMARFLDDGRGSFGPIKPLVMASISAVQFAVEGSEASHASVKRTDSTFHSFNWPINCKFPGSIYMLI